MEILGSSTEGLHPSLLAFVPACRQAYRAIYTFNPDNDENPR